MIWFIQSLLTLTVLAATPLAHAQVNKCVDPTGKTIYSQSPCPTNTKSSAVRQTVPGGSVSSAPATGPASASSAAGAKPSGPKTAAELEQEFRKRRVEQEETQKKTQDKLAESKIRDENCKLSRGQLAGLEIGGRQMRTNEKGERYSLDESQTAGELEKARKSVQEWCK